MNSSGSRKVRDDNVAGMVVGGGKSRRFSFKRIKLTRKWAIPFLIVLIASLVLAYWYYQRQSTPKYTGNVCSSKAAGSLLVQANEAIQNTEVDALNKVAAKVQKLSGYQNDPKCLMIMTNYYIYNGDHINARAYLKKLDEAYGTQPIIGTYYIGGKNINDLRDNVSFLEKQAEEASKGAVTVGEPKP